jgi:predicted branched-subunit amino acid permease
MTSAPTISASDESDDLGGRSVGAWYREGARQALGGPMLIVAASLVGVGGIARDAGFSLEVAVGSTIFIWAGPAQLLFFSAVAAKMAWPAIAVSISLSSVRFVPMCVALLPMLRARRTRNLSLIAAAHCISVTTWAEAMRRLPPLPRAARMPFFLGFSSMCLLGTSCSTAVGHALIGQMSRPFAAGLLFLTPIYFVSTLLRAARQPIDWMALVLGLAIAPFAQAWAPAGFDLPVLGAIGGTLAFIAQRLIDARKVDR